MIKIIITDDHPMMIDGIKTALKDNTTVEIIGKAYNGKDLLALLQIKKPDIILLDISMPEMDGLQVASKIKQSYRDIKIIMLTQYNYRRFIKHCQEIGVEGYILKNFSSSELNKAIITVNSGGLYYNTKPPNLLITEHPLQTYGRPKFSTQELEVLKLLAQDKNYSEISIALKISNSTVKTYVNRLKDKSGTKNTTGMVSWAYQNDIVQRICKL